MCRNKCNIKRNQLQNPIVNMLKSEVEERPLGDFGVMPQGVEASFKTWWRGLLPASKVEVRYPHERHGNAGRVSNSAKAGTRE